MRVRGTRAKAGAVAGLAAALGTGVLLAGCAPGSNLATDQPSATPAAARLVAFDSCSQLLDRVRAQALEEVGPDGLTSGASGASRAGGVASAAVPGTERTTVDAPMAAAGAASAAPSDASSQASSGSTPDSSVPSFSSTNDQEAGVDEPDVAKTDGNLLVALRQDTQTLEVADVATTPRLRGSLSLSNVVDPTGLFLVDGDAVVLGPGPSPTPVPVPLEGSASGSPLGTAETTSTSAETTPIEGYDPTTVVAVVSLANPDNPVVTRSFTLQGSEVDARLIGGHIEVVVTSSPTLPFVAPNDGSAPAQAAALAANQSVIRTSQPSDWLPSVTSEPSGVTQTTACTAAMAPAEASGLGTVSVIPIDPTADQPGPEASVVGDATTVYASATTLYVATTAWTPQPGPSSPTGSTGPGTTSVGGGPAAVGGAGVVNGPDIAFPPSGDASTDIHGFDLSDPGAPQYLGSGEVPGTLIGQYALSEYQGVLRVATTVGSATPPPNEGVAPSTLSDNRVTILRPQGGSLVTVGTLTGLGTGEKIYAVRFMGPLGYVVTFRQTDPLYVLDLHDPTHPVASGQLPLSGYSSFLQPLSDNLLLGVGQEVDQNLRTTGLQVSLFDVSDPVNPKLLSKDVLSDASSTAENDPHALLYWAPAQLAVMPVSQYGSVPVDDGTAAPTAPFDGAVAFSVAGGTLSEAGRLSQPAPAPSGQTSGSYGGVPIPVDIPPGAGVAAPGAIAMPYDAGTTIERALVVGSMLYTVSESGIMASDLSSFAQSAWLAYS